MNLSQFDNLAVRTLNLREEFQGQDSMAMQHIESLCTWAGPQLKQLTVIEGSHNFSDDMWDRHPDSWRVIEIESSLMEAITYVDPDHLTTFTSTSRFFSRYLDSSNSIKRKFKRMLGRNPHLGTPSCRVALMGSHERRIPNENAWFIPRKPEDHPAYKWERMSYHTTPCLRDTSTPYFIFTNKWKNPEKCVHVLVFWSYEEDLAVYVNADGTLQSSMDYLSEFFEGLWRNWLLTTGSGWIMLAVNLGIDIGFRPTEVRESTRRIFCLKVPCTVVFIGQRYIIATFFEIFFLHWCWPANGRDIKDLWHLLHADANAAVDALFQSITVSSSITSVQDCELRLGHLKWSSHWWDQFTVFKFSLIRMSSYLKSQLNLRIHTDVTAFSALLIYLKCKPGVTRSCSQTWSSTWCCRNCLRTLESLIQNRFAPKPRLFPGLFMFSVRCDMRH